MKAPVTHTGFRQCRNHLYLETLLIRSMDRRITGKEITACMDLEGCDRKMAIKIITHNRGWKVPCFDKLKPGTLITWKNGWQEIVLRQTDKSYICRDRNGDKRINRRLPPSVEITWID